MKCGGCNNCGCTCSKKKRRRSKRNTTTVYEETLSSADEAEVPPSAGAGNDQLKKMKAIFEALQLDFDCFKSLPGQKRRQQVKIENMTHEECY